MALPSSGTISASQINVELGRSATASYSMGGAAERVLADRETGSVSKSHFRGIRGMSDPVSIAPFTPTSGMDSGKMYYTNIDSLIESDPRVVILWFRVYSDYLQIKLQDGLEYPKYLEILVPEYPANPTNQGGIIARCHVKRGLWVDSSYLMHACGADFNGSRTKTTNQNLADINAFYTSFYNVFPSGYSGLKLRIV